MCEAAEKAFARKHAEGIAEGNRKIALKMLRAGKEDREILEFTELTEESLGELKKEI